MILPRLSRFWLEMSGDDDESVVAGLWWVGLLLSAGAQVSGVVGNQFMKRAHRQNESRSERNKIPQYKVGLEPNTILSSPSAYTLIIPHTVTCIQ